MYTRSLTIPNSSFFLFGPRGTGKSSWLKTNLPDAIWYDFLDQYTYLRILGDPGVLSREINSQPSSWVVMDEVQRVPAVLNAVHSIIFSNPEKYKFALTGSSARKLKRNESNMLAGRAISKNFFPLTSAELGSAFNIDFMLRFGSLPRVYTLCVSGDPSLAVSTLESYVSTYLEVEIQREAQLRNFEGFVRFLKVAALMHGQILNVSQTASDGRIARTTASGYFGILTDTLIGYILPAWQTRAKVKEVEHPRFYMFDAGIVRALTGTLREPLDSQERGRLLEGIVLNELRAYIMYRDCGGDLAYWRTSDGAEVDFVWKRGKRVIAFEIKSTLIWTKKFQRGLRLLSEVVPNLEKYGIYLGNQSQIFEQMTVLPLQQFLEQLWEGKIIKS